MTAPLEARTRLAFDLTVGALAIGTAAVLFRLAGDVDPLLASALRLGIASVPLSFVVARASREGRLGPRVLRAGILGGVLYAVHFGAWVASLGMTSIAASVTLVTATPILLALIATLRKHDRPSARQWGAIAITACGVTLIGGFDLFRTEALLGDGLALLGALAMAFYLLVARGLGDELDPLPLAGIATAVGALVLGATCAARVVLGAGIGWPNHAQLGWIALSALIPQLVGHVLLTRALRQATPTTVGLATCAEPVIATLLAVPVLGEVPAPLVIVGCAITLLGVVLGAR